MAEPDLARRIEASLAEAAAAQGRLRDIHNVRVRETSGGVIVLFHCRVDPATPVETVHDAVDSLERSVRKAFPEARRVSDTPSRQGRKAASDEPESGHSRSRHARGARPCPCVTAEGTRSSPGGRSSA